MLGVEEKEGNVFLKYWTKVRDFPRKARSRLLLSNLA